MVSVEKRMVSVARKCSHYTIANCASAKLMQNLEVRLFYILFEVSYQRIHINMSNYITTHPNFNGVDRLRH